MDRNIAIVTRRLIAYTMRGLVFSDDQYAGDEKRAARRPPVKVEGIAISIESITINGFKSVTNLTLERLSPFTALAGSNGAGKSNITDALAFFGAIVKRGASTAIRDFGGFQQIHCFKHRKQKRTTISFEIKIQIEHENFEYALKIVEIDKAPQVVENLKINGTQYIDRKQNGETKVTLTDYSPLQSFLEYPQDMTALMLLSNSALYKFLTNIRVYRIDPIAAKEPDNSTADATMLDSHGRNVATMLSILEKDKHFRTQVLEWIELIVPGMENVSTEKQRLDSTTVITFKEEGTRTHFPARLISDGTIYALCIMTAVLSRTSQAGLTIIEEPERGIHPKAIGELVALMRDNATVDHPVFITTHSESVVRNLNPEELWLVNKLEGRTNVKCAAESRVDKKQIPLDTAWLTNLFDGGLPW
ncbi:AAA family ATPase [Pseudomonas sp. K2I15]|uniref:AAA family ATPase n=1 Tax=unclassified Pseudomonas TaxID=196821 RepID=UPI0021152BBA|nr:AAA family ATPase [Pseudomonas sp. K2I15]